MARMPVSRKLTLTLLLIPLVITAMALSPEGTAAVVGAGAQLLRNCAQFIADVLNEFAHR